MPDLRFDGVSISYTTQSDSGRGEVPAVVDLNLDIPAGTTLGIAGESGSGKSTLAMAVLRLLPRNARISGRIMLGERNVLELSFGQLRAVRWSEAAIVFQGAMHSLNPVRKIGPQIAEALELHIKDDYRTEDARRSRVLDLLAQVDLPAVKADAFPHELSGGQKQRVMIAMALACDPEVIIADEPTTALDVVVQAQVLDVLGALVRDRGITLLMISHDLSVLGAACSKIAVMQAGRIVEEGPSEQIVNAPRHPHTQALAEAFPTIGDPASRLNPVSRHSADEAAALTGAAAVTGTAGPIDDRTPADGAQPEREVLLEARNLNVSFRGRSGTVQAVKDVSLRAHAGEVVALVGQSGSGKTTLARTLLALQGADSGQVLFRGEPVTARAGQLKSYRRQVQLILQDPSSALNPKHSIYESVAEGIRIHGLPGDERERVSAAMKLAELNPPEQFFSAIPQELSGGQRQRVVIAGALALEPDFLVADEPVASLDASVRGEILALLLRLKNTLNLGALVITHDLGLAWNIADRVLVMYQGRIVEAGPVEDVLLRPQHEYTRKLLSVVPVADGRLPIDAPEDAPEGLAGQSANSR
ncbi:ABC transporter ATP-binding protein [Saxibacter everestensis]|uniref:ABC transporter ATP-binding protein n=1 Tax=Saxibacter everestensis TaxID=2909229 RepID=A0ABY8QX39_9MICO|nr:ABC transporter ATP-binding protein [Brevibacteriaceae bacterium ZFBP1038]